MIEEYLSLAMAIYLFMVYKSFEEICVEKRANLGLKNW